MLSLNNRTIIRKSLLSIAILTIAFLVLSLSLNSANIILILDSAGIHVSRGLAAALTTIGGVYGVQQFLISALGVTVPLWAAGAVAACGAAGV